MTIGEEALAALRDLLSSSPVPAAVCRMRKLRVGSYPAAELGYLAYDSIYDVFRFQPDAAALVLSKRQTMADLAAAVRERMPDAVLLDEFVNFAGYGTAAERSAVRLLRQILRSAPVHIDRVSGLRGRIEAILLLEELQ